MEVFHLHIRPWKYDDFFQQITQDIHTIQGKGKSVFTPNPEILLTQQKDVSYRALLQNASYLTSDGIGLYIAYQIQDSTCGRWLHFCLLPYYFFQVLFCKERLYTKYGERVCGSDITLDIVEYAQRNKIRIAIIDLYNPTDTQKVANQKIFSSQLQRAYPNLLFDYYVYAPKEQKNILKSLGSSKAQIVFSTLGMKHQEQSIAEILQACPNIRLGLAIGSSFDYITGFQKRAPKILRRMWFEWLYRIFTSPNKWKRIQRIYQALVVFPIRVILYKQ